VSYVVDIVRRENASAKKSASHADFFDVASHARAQFIALVRTLSMRVSSSFKRIAGLLTASPSDRSFIANR